MAFWRENACSDEPTQLLPGALEVPKWQLTTCMERSLGYNQTYFQNLDVYYKRAGGEWIVRGTVKELDL
ncbi:hypothetical protein [Paenibacillus ihbetae]|uniref:Uncharacterized protein n=1 Tax=Paenibacillus ihbetae TaxID=1870820 RepID=A0A1B2E659_9BACL|nr:hypothetical protein [Paenibacillus ihbetae]ANY75382.1 hypothetical protein BBD41_23955 [Paenibacillus ihbetae]OOC62449.1 hypothetical protein BBD40_11600 [Paenibacillus ihbetae]